jgi:uncharacterized iron-regulated protein
MHKDSPVTCTIKSLATFLLIFWVLMVAEQASSSEYEVPNSGSPYLDLRTIADNQIVHLPTGIKVNFDQMMQAVAGSRVIYVGETHDSLEDHRIQLQVIRWLAKRGKIAVGMEMFRRSAQPELDLWIKEASTEKKFRKLFKKNWGSGIKLYQPIFDTLKEQSIPLIGLKSTREMEAAFRAGDVAPGDTFYPELDDTDPYHRAHSMSLFGGHQDHVALLEKPYRMLLLWEETMAQTVAQFISNEKNRDRKLVVLAGGFHVQYGFGIPKRAYRRMPHQYSIILPTITQMPEELKESREMKVEHVHTPLYSADYAWKVSYKVLPKNRIKLGVLLAEEEVGVRVRSVAKNSNAERAGILAGDLLLQADGKKIIDVEEMVSFLQSKNFGDEVNFRLRRDSAEQVVTVTLQKK